MTTALTPEELQLYSDLMSGSKVRMDSKRTAFVQKWDEFKNQNPDLNPYKTLLAMVNNPLLLTLQFRLILADISISETKHR